MRTIYDTTAILTNTRNEIEVEAEVDNVRENESLDAYVATNKIKMIWNGKIYVGNAHGMEFTTLGPKSRTIKGRY
jgi:hypothetical protein|tara:strand:- start:415 stop:639 length:225 start_codon:yes stop_codon:yes gene_type:complete